MNTPEQIIAGLIEHNINVRPDYLKVSKKLGWFDFEPEDEYNWAEPVVAKIFGENPEFFRGMCVSVVYLNKETIDALMLYHQLRS